FSALIFPMRGTERRKAQSVLSGRSLAGSPRLPALHPPSLAQGELRRASLAASHRGISVRDTGSRTALPGTWLGTGVTRLCRSQSSELLAGRSWCRPGGNPGTARERGHDPRPQAPHPLPLSRRPVGSAPRGEGERNISLLTENVNRPFRF